MKRFINDFWEHVGQQNADNLKSFFNENAIIRWHNSNEQFTAEEFIRATCEYPDEWESTVERMEVLDNLMITVALVRNKVKNLSFYATSFFQIENGKISILDEYWGNNGFAPTWRKELKIGKPIHG